jgi:hypothetical protein
LRAFLDKLGNVEGAVLDRLIDLNVVLPGCGRPDAVVIFHQPSQQPHPGLRIGPTPMLAHALFPQIPRGVIPVVVKEGKNLLQVPVFKRVDVLSQWFQSDPSLGFTVRMVEEIHQLSNDLSEALH